MSEQKILEIEGEITGLWRYCNEEFSQGCYILIGGMFINIPPHQAVAFDEAYERYICGGFSDYIRLKVVPTNRVIHMRGYQQKMDFEVVGEYPHYQAAQEAREIEEEARRQAYLEEFRKGKLGWTLDVKE
jgi:hypothetical protein